MQGLQGLQGFRICRCIGYSRSIQRGVRHDRYMQYMYKYIHTNIHIYVRGHKKYALGITCCVPKQLVGETLDSLFLSFVRSLSLSLSLSTNE